MSRSWWLYNRAKHLKIEQDVVVVVVVVGPDIRQELVLSSLSFLGGPPILGNSRGHNGLACRHRSTLAIPKYTEAEIWRPQ